MTLDGILFNHLNIVVMIVKPLSTDVFNSQERFSVLSVITPHGLLSSEDIFHLTKDYWALVNIQNMTLGDIETLAKDICESHGFQTVKIFTQFQWNFLISSVQRKQELLKMLMEVESTNESLGKDLSHNISEKSAMKILHFSELPFLGNHHPIASKFKTSKNARSSQNIAPSKKKYFWQKWFL
jgi:hypothetical protein